MTRREWVPKKVVEVQESICEFTEVTEGLVVDERD